MFERVAIIGVGLIGGSLGLALKERQLAKSVVGVEVDRERGDTAVKVGAVDKCTDLAPAVAGADLIVLAIPIKVERVMPLLLRLGGYHNGEGWETSVFADQEALLPFRPNPPARLAPPHALVTDVGSTKRSITIWGDTTLPGQFVGGHPMAGSERSGVEAARADLFVGATWVLTPTEKSEPQAIQSLHAMVEAVGAKPLILSAAEHDRTVALTSHLPHLLAYALAARAQKNENVTPQWRELTAGSWKSGTRVAKSSPALWTEILMDNCYEIAPLLCAYRDDLDALLLALNTQDRARLHEILNQGYEATWDKESR